MKIDYFLDKVRELGIDFYTGVPDSQLKVLCDHLMGEYGIGDQHIIAANEGAAVGLAAGHYLATHHPALVYMQNSGIGNAINPICSLLNDKVYAIPALFVVGWRGEPGIKDEPQHVFQGEITVKLLECLQIKHVIIDKNTTQEEFSDAIQAFKEEFAQGRCGAFVIKKGAFELDYQVVYENAYPLSREAIVNLLVDHTNESDVFVSTTGKLSRELFEARETRNQSHKYDFLTVGSMGHASMIALTIAKEKPMRRVFCLDGDGAVLMHMGSMAVLGANQPKNMVHILINNEAHETVGGMPTVSKEVDFQQVATACGYQKTYTATNEAEIQQVFTAIKERTGPLFVEIKANLKSREDLGRPTTTPIQNKDAFMAFLQEN